MEGQITILHLSDIHFKWKKIETFREDVEEKMIDTIKAHLDNIHSELDFVAVTGDIAFSGKKERGQVKTMAKWRVERIV
jgi:predicted MPP superfamily phosphohydrolase